MNVSGLPDTLSDLEQQEMGRAFLLMLNAATYPVDGIRIEFEEEVRV